MAMVPPLHMVDPIPMVDPMPIVDSRPMAVKINILDTTPFH